MVRRPRFGVGGRLAIALVLTLGPTVALGYFGYRSVTERERTLRLSYTATGTLVRDRLSTELAGLEASLQPDIAAPTADGIPAIQTWLRSVASQRPWLAQPFVIRTGGGVVREDLWRNWQEAGGRQQPADTIPAEIRDAESAEFIQDDLDVALRHYRRALAVASTARARALALSRIGRTLFKLRRFDQGLASYQAVLTLPHDTLDAYGIPYPVIALSQIHDGLDALGRTGERDRTSRELQRYVAAHPWDEQDGYGYYVRGARQLTVVPDPDLDRDLAAAANAATTIEWIERELVPTLETGLVASRSDDQARRLSVMREGAPIVIGIQPLRAARPDAARTALGFTIRTDYVAGPLLREIVAGVELGADLRVIISSDAPTAEPQPLASVPLGDQFPGWSVAIVDARGRTIEQLTALERWAYGGLVGGVLVVLVAGVIFTMRAWTREAELSRVRTDFVSNVSHELKTPLALIRMFGETLESGMVVDADKRQEFYGIIRRESERLTHLINNVLDTATIEAGTKQFTLERSDVVLLVREALDAYAPLFARLSFAVETTLPDAPLAVTMDRDAVAQALVNLFQNAIKYSGDSKHLAVAVADRAGETVVSVADRGLGIPAGDLSRIFDKFYRSRATGAAESSGSGLGLSIVKHVMTAHGGRVEVRSTVGQGSVFSLVFPKAA